MQLHAVYTSVWDEGKVESNAAICTIEKQIVSCETSEDGDDFEHLSHEFVTIEHDGQHFEFECEQGIFTDQGQKDFTNLLENNLLK
jgi:hypothetical protein